MSRESGFVQDQIQQYLLSVTVREPPVLAELRTLTATHPRSSMQIAPEQGQLFSLLIQLMGARKTLEIGVFTGYSSIAVALALPPDGKLVACDISEEYTQTAREFWGKAGVAGKIDLRIGPALDTLDRMIASGESGNYDFAFIDADKTSYDGYFERCLRLLRKGGLIAVDNVLQDGKVVDDSSDDPNVLAIQRFNRKLHADERVSLSMLPVGDGITLAVKR